MNRLSWLGRTLHTPTKRRLRCTLFCEVGRSQCLLRHKAKGYENLDQQTTSYKPSQSIGLGSVRSNQQVALPVSIPCSLSDYVTLWYIGYRTKRSSKKKSKQVPAAPYKDKIQNTNSAILHLVDSGHQAEPTALKRVLETPRFHTKGLRRRLLMASEVIEFRLVKLELYEQRKLIQPLLLP